MKKITMSMLLMLAITTLLIAKTYTIKGTYTGSRCGDLCYMNFDTEWGNVVSLCGYAEDYKNIHKGKKYKVDYIKNMKIEVAELGELKVKGITKITAISQSSSSSKTAGKYSSYLKKECKSFGVPYCYLEKRYDLFLNECTKGDQISCKNIKDIDKAIRTEDLEGINYLSNTAKTGSEK